MKISEGQSGKDTLKFEGGTGKPGIGDLYE
jgi:hypothetical protein